MPWFSTRYDWMSGSHAVTTLSYGKRRPAYLRHAPEENFGQNPDFLTIAAQRILFELTRI